MSGCIIAPGGAGFIGANFVIQALSTGQPVVNLDKLAYVGNLANPVHTFVHGDIDDVNLIAALLYEHRPSTVVHFGAGSHVDRFIATVLASWRTWIRVIIIIRLQIAFLLRLAGSIRIKKGDNFALPSRQVPT